MKEFISCKHWKRMQTKGVSVSWGPNTGSCVLVFQRPCVVDMMQPDTTPERRKKRNVQSSRSRDESTAFHVKSASHSFVPPHPSSNTQKGPDLHKVSHPCGRKRQGQGNIHLPGILVEFPEVDPRPIFCSSMQGPVCIFIQRGGSVQK